MSSDHSSRDVIRAVTVWVILQLIAMGLVVARFQFWNNANVGDRNALAIVIAIQIVGASMLVGVLMPNRWAALFVLLSSMPFVQLAGLLAASSTSDTLRAGALVLLWLATLWTWSSVANGTVSRALLSAVATGVSLGMLLLNYLKIEFSESGRALAVNQLLALSVLLVVSLISRQLIHKIGG
jgi:hypothetical protein